MGAGFIPRVLERALLDEVIRVSSQEAVEAARSLARQEGILVGISSGAAMRAAIRWGGVGGERAVVSDGSMREVVGVLEPQLNCDEES